MTHQAAILSEDVAGVSTVPSSTLMDGYIHSQSHSQLSAGDSYSYNYSAGGGYTGMVGGFGDNDPEAVDGDSAGAAAGAFDTLTMGNGGHGYTVDDGYGDSHHTTAGGDATVADASPDSTLADPEGTLLLLQQQRQQYRSWIAQFAAAALASLDSSYASSVPYASSRHGSAGGMAAGVPADAVPDDVPGLVTAMDAAGTVRQYLLSLKVLFN
ncbi:hypothetical protein Vretifemale_19126 [Volvox reticuliferus]|uniref:Uncharacterized protein n=1 Tax=Volvox reticuliferus TaxID=1737510 RepID=A0A8J4D0X4_9CHLO|nr:hypothetical protein Vretifemale_19126 [Volvox reticuliferus]